MSKFPAGSKIIITNAEEGETYKNGDIFTVNETNGVGVWISCADGSCYISSYEFEAYTESFTVGDRVRVLTDSDLPYLKKGDVGTVTEIGAGMCIQQDAPFTRGDGAWWVAANNAQIEEPLDVAPRTIAFEDIKKGDTIRAEYTQNGVKHTREGTVATTSWNDEQWFSAEGDYVADSFQKGATYTLLERPEPRKPNPFAEAKVGSLGLVKEHNYLFLKEADNKWRCIHTSGAWSDNDGYDDKFVASWGDRIKITHKA